MLNTAYGRGDFIVATFPTKEEYEKHKLELPQNSLALIEEFPIDKEYVDNGLINALSEAKTYVDEALKQYYTIKEIDHKFDELDFSHMKPFTFTKQYKNKTEMMNDRDNIKKDSFVLISAPEGEKKDVDDGKLYQKQETGFVYIANLTKEDSQDNSNMRLKVWDFTD